MPTIYNKVELDGTTLLDLSQDTASSASHIRQGYTAHLNDGTQVTGTYTGSSPTIQSLTVNPSTTQQTFNASGVDGYKPVTVNAMPSGTAGTPTAAKGSVSNHTISVTPSVTNTTGYITGSTINGTAVSVSASELVSGNLAITQNGNNIDVTNYETVSVSVSGGGGSSLSVGTVTATPTSSSTILFENLVDQPTSFVVISANDISTSAPPNIATVVFDGMGGLGQGITTTSNAQVSYLSSGTFMPSFNAGDLQIQASGAQFVTSNTYKLIYTYGGSASNISTADVQVGSGATSITFTGLEDEPAYFSCIFKSNFSTSSGYQRVIAVVNDGTDTYGLEMDSQAHYSSAHWSYSYNNGSLTITSSGTNTGGYFHQPGYYQLTYAYDDGSSGNYQSKTVTPTTSQQVVEADSGYDALKRVTVNAIPSEYIVPSGNINITSNTATGQTLNVAQYATATVAVPTGGGVNIATETTTNSSNQNTSISFTLPSGRTPKAFFARLTSHIARSSNSRYYYVFDMRWDGSSTGGVAGNTFYMSSGTLTNVTSGYSYSQSGTTFTLSSTGSRSASPGSFYNGTYELVYIY